MTVPFDSPPLFPIQKPNSIAVFHREVKDHQKATPLLLPAVGTGSGGDNLLPSCTPFTVSNPKMSSGQKERPPHHNFIIATLHTHVCVWTASKLPDSSGCKRRASREGVPAGTMSTFCADGTHSQTSGADCVIAGTGMIFWVVVAPEERTNFANKFCKLLLRLFGKRTKMVF